MPPRAGHTERRGVVAITSRRARGVADLVAAAETLSRAWSAGSPRVAAARGDLDWWFCQAWPAALGDRLRLWRLDGKTVGWSWHDVAAIDYHVWTGSETGDGAVERAILDRAVAEAMRRQLAGGDGSVEAWAADDDERTLRLLAELGFARLGSDSTPIGGHRLLSQFQRRVDDGSPIDEAPLASGYRIRAVSGPDDFVARVEVHRAAFAPSRMRVEKYRRLSRLPDYRFEDDLVVEAPDSSFAAFAIAWWDPIARVGELEPVGTHPAHQRRGLARALLCHALRRYRELGAVVVQVFSDGDNVASEALYEAVAFRRRTWHRRYRRPPIDAPWSSGSERAGLA